MHEDELKQYIVVFVIFVDFVVVFVAVIRIFIITLVTIIAFTVFIAIVDGLLLFSLRYVLFVKVSISNSPGGFKLGPRDQQGATREC